MWPTWLRSRKWKSKQKSEDFVPCQLFMMSIIMIIDVGTLMLQWRIIEQLHFWGNVYNFHESNQNDPSIQDHLSNCQLLTRHLIVKQLSLRRTISPQCIINATKILVSQFSKQLSTKCSKSYILKYWYSNNLMNDMKHGIILLYHKWKCSRHSVAFTQIQVYKPI